MPSDLEPDAVLPNANDISASFQHTVFAHICKRLQRGMMFEEMQGHLPKDNKNLVKTFAYIKRVN